MTGGKVLVLGDDTRSFLATVRSLGRRGITVHVAPANFRSPALLSRYIAAIHEVPPWIGDGREWLCAMEPLLRSERFDLVIPCNETALLPLQHHRAELGKLARLAIPDDRAIAVLFDKHETRQLAQRVGVPVARGRLAQSDDTSHGVLAEFGAPVVVKPRYSYRLNTLGLRGKAHLIRGAAQLSAVLNGSDPNDILLEQFFPGQGAGVSLLAHDGRILQAFEHHRVREIAGASFYRVSAPLTPHLLQACKAMVASLQYSGLAMFEFKRAADDKWILLEVNARPWGSMPLPVALGIDFPYRWYQLLTLGEESPELPYRTGVYGRNLLPDLHAWLGEAADRDLSGAARFCFLATRTVELSRMLTMREVHDVLVRDDPRPGLIELRELAATVRQRMLRRIPGARIRGRARARARVVRALRDHERPVLVFVCQGNICRSPFAEALLRARVSDNTIAVRSAGMMSQPGRSTPPFGITAAAAFGVDLAAHRSSWLNPHVFRTASLLMVFDETNRAAVLDRYPPACTKLVHLGDLAGLGNIEDPIDGNLDDFLRTYERIVAAITELVSLLQG